MIKQVEKYWSHGDPYWTMEAPNKVGVYWYYGNPFALTKESEGEGKRLHLVKVIQASNALVYIATGNFMENKIGWWQDAKLPELPKGE